MALCMKDVVESTWTELMCPECGSTIEVGCYYDEETGRHVHHCENDRCCFQQDIPENERHPD